MVAKRVIFEGRVQGVGFRYTVKDLARGFEVCGWVKNLPDGSVELQAMADADELNDFIHEIVAESPMAPHIKNHWTENIPPLADCSGFSIVR